MKLKRWTSQKVRFDVSEKTESISLNDSIVVYGLSPILKHASFDIHNIRIKFYYLILDECIRLFDHLLKDVIQIDKIIPWIL